MCLSLKWALKALVSSTGSSRSILSNIAYHVSYHYLIILHEAASFSKSIICNRTKYRCCLEVPVAIKLLNSLLIPNLHYTHPVYLMSPPCRPNERAPQICTDLFWLQRQSNARVKMDEDKGLPKSNSLSPSIRFESDERSSRTQREVHQHLDWHRTRDCKR